MALNPEFWRRCTTCKKPIAYGAKYWICSVSTCNRVRTNLVFCDLKCFDAHVPVVNHRDAGAFEKVAPSKNQAAAEAHGQDQPQSSEEEILVVVSKVKAYIRSRSGMNTSDSVMSLLSEKIRQYAKQGIRNAEAHGRKTVMERDF